MYRICILSLLLLGNAPSFVWGKANSPGSQKVALSVSSGGVVRAEESGDDLGSYVQEELENRLDHSDISLVENVPAPAGHEVSKTIRVISDLHIGGCWFAHKKVQKQLLTMLKDMADGNTKVSELVLLGDIFDLSLVPLNTTTKYPTEVMTNPDTYGMDAALFVRRIKEVAESGIKIYAVRGNHDEWLTKEMYTEVFGDAVTFMEDGFSLHSIWFEHGHLIDNVAHTYYDQDDQPVLPFGYFLSRARATNEGSCGAPGLNGQERQPRPRPGKKGGGVAEQIDKLLNSNEMRQYEKETEEQTLEGMTLEQVAPMVRFLLTGDNYLTQWLLRLMRGALNANFNDVEETKKFTVVGADKHRIKWGKYTHDYTLYDALMDHKDDLTRIVDRYGIEGASERILATMSDFTHWVKHDQNHDMVVVGHSHLSELEKLPRANPDKSVSKEVIYVNSGSWTLDPLGAQRHSIVDILLEPTYIENSLVDLGGAAPAGPYRPVKAELWEYGEKEPRHKADVKPSPRRGNTKDDMTLHPLGKKEAGYFAAATRVSLSTCVLGYILVLFAMVTS